MGQWISTTSTPEQQPPSNNNNDENNSPQVFNSKYALNEKLGAGAFSVVYLCENRSTQEKFAVKCIKKSELSENDVNALHEEVSILRSIQHPNVLLFVDSFDEHSFYYLVTELIEGGELFDRIVQRVTYNEQAARDTIRTLLQTISYLHSQNIIHRDLKPENLLLRSKESDTEIKLADFGFAKHVLVPDSLKTVCGTPDYVAPEIISKKNYGLKADIWSIGVISFILLGGYPPFYDDNQQALFSKIKKGKFEYEPTYWAHISKQAKDCINSMLVVNPDSRSSAQELLNHPFLHIEASELESHDLMVNLEQFRKFNHDEDFVVLPKQLSLQIDFLTQGFRMLQLPQMKIFKTLIQLSLFLVLKKKIKNQKTKTKIKKKKCFITS